MAVSVRPACSMPRLHSLDFDLSPKNQFDVSRARWGNSSPVLILSLLEIVEQDSIHVREAAPRLQPGWVRNACAAFEKGVAFSDYESHQNTQNTINCQISDVQNSSNKSPNKKTGVKSRLPKAKSLDSLDSCRKKSPKKAKVPLPEVRNKTSVGTSCVACNRSLVHQEDTFKSQKNCQAAISKRLPSFENNEVSVSVKLPKATKVEEHSGVSHTGPACNSAAEWDGQNSEVFSPHKLPFNSECSNNVNDIQTVAKSELANEVAPNLSNPEKCQDNYTRESPLERVPSVNPSAGTSQPVGDVCVVQGPRNVPGEEVAPVYAIAPLSQQHEQEQIDGARSHDSLYQSQMKVELQEDVKSTSSIPAANSVGAEQTQLTGSSDMPSVRPKIRLSSVSASEQDTDKADIDGENDTTVKNCMVHHGFAKVAVNVKSFSIPVKGRSELGNTDSEKEYECAEPQCAIGVSATDIHLRGVPHRSHESDGCSSQVHHNSTVSCRKQGSAGQCKTQNDKAKFLEESPGLTITLANMHHYPPDRLETFLLIKEIYKNSFPISWENFVVHFNSSRQLVVPRERFCAKFAVSFENEKDRSNNMESIKEALAKKWSRSDGRLEERKQRLSVLKLGSLRFQLLCHPLVSYDISELEEGESDSEEEILEAVTPFRYIPTYYIAKIFRFLKTKDLAALKCTCKDFYWLINQFDITGTDSQWVTGKEYRADPCMHCGKIQDPRGDVSLCQRHPKAFYKYSVINRQYWTCCNAVKETTEGCEIGLHNNRWTTSKFQPNFICRPWKSQSWYVTANTERWCDKEHL